jgi:hypothetical protein
MTERAQEFVTVRGVVREGERVEVELIVGGDVAASATSGAELRVQTAEGEVRLDSTALSLADREAVQRRGLWSELSALPEAALVRDRAPAPHERASLSIRRVGPGDAISIVGVVTGRAFDGERALRQPATRRVSTARALSWERPLAPAGAARSPVTGVHRSARLALVWGLALVVGLADVLPLVIAPRLLVLLVAASGLVAVGSVARFVHRATRAAPPMDARLAHPFLRLFARGARSLPRFAPRERDASRRAVTFLGPVVCCGLAYLSLIAIAWPVGALAGDIDPTSLSTEGSAGILALLCASLTTLALAYAVADSAELPRVRALLEARASGAWRTWSGIALAGPGGSEEPLLVRRVVLESDAPYSEAPTFSAHHEERGVDRLAVRTSEAEVLVERVGLLWDSTDWSATLRTADTLVRPGARVMVGGYAEGNTLIARGAGSMLVYASRDAPPEETLRRALRRRWFDVTLAGAAALFVGAAALGALLL